MTPHLAPLSLQAPLGRLRAILAGAARSYTRAGSLSAIDKQPVHGTVWVGALGVQGDEQGDRRVHGGPDKAIHCYPWASYEAWRGELPGAVAEVRLQQPGAFGENFSLDGLDESNTCVGDRWTIGEALFEVSQLRQPCWKLNDRFGVADMARRVQRSGRSGWYLRVLVPGHVSAGDAIRLAARPHPAWPLARLQAIVADRVCDAATLRAALALPLTPSWVRLLQARLDSGRVESWGARMDGAPEA
jgi:MOSC domain-containing protein YiiM